MALALAYSILSLVLFTNLDRFLFSFLVSLNFMGLMRPHDSKTGWHRFPSLIRQSHLNKLTELDLEAVRCAYDIQRATREFNITLPNEKRVHLRVGVHLGDVVESQGDISGDAVNVASRIEPLAEDGGVCLTQQVYDHVKNKFELQLESLGIKSLKNVSTPLGVYRMVMPWNEERVAPTTQLDRNRVAVLPRAHAKSHEVSPSSRRHAEMIILSILVGAVVASGGLLSRPAPLSYAVVMDVPQAAEFQQTEQRARG